MPQLTHKLETLALALIVAIPLAAVAEFTVSSQAAAEDLRTYLPNGFYRQISGDKKVCPSGHFEWVDKNTTLAIGGASPVLFHTFNDRKTRPIPFQKSSCTSETTNQVTVSNSDKKNQRLVEQTVKTLCDGQTTITVSSLQAAKQAGKLNVTLNIQVTHEGPKTVQSPAVHCLYETGASK